MIGGAPSFSRFLRKGGLPRSRDAAVSRARGHFSQSKDACPYPGPGRCKSREWCRKTGVAAPRFPGGAASGTGLIGGRESVPYTSPRSRKHTTSLTETSVQNCSLLKQLPTGATRPRQGVL